MGLRELPGIDAQLLQFEAAVVVDHDVGVAQQSVDVGLAGLLGQIKPGAAGSNVGFEVDPVVLEIIGTGRAQHVGALLGQDASHRGSGDGMGERQHPHTAERPIGRAKVARRGVADPGQPDDRLAGQQSSVRMGQPLLRAAGHTRRQTGLIGSFFQLEGIPISKCLSDFGEVGWHVEEATPVGCLMRVNRRSHHGAPVAGAVGNQRKRVIQHQRDRRELPGQGGLPRKAGVDVVYRLAKIEVQVLPGPAAVAVHRRRGNCVAHHRDTDRGAESVTGRNDRVLSGECHPAARVGDRQPDIGEQLAKSNGRIERLVARRHRVGCISHDKDSSPHRALWLSA